MKKPDIGYYLGLPPRDALAYIESLEPKPTESWHDLVGIARANAFTVAGMTRLDLLQDTLKILQKAVKDGMTDDTFRKILEPELAKKGWTGKRQAGANPETGEVREKGPGISSRLNLIFFQNMQTAYMAGRYRAMLANADDRPWWMYVAVLDSRTRPGHAALNGRVFRYDDVFWQKFYPPNGFYCRCTVRALDDDDLKAEGITPEKGEEHMVTREAVLNPRAPAAERKKIEVWGFQPERNGPVMWTDPGFSWSPGYGTWGIDHVLAQKLDDLKSPALYAQVVEYMNNSTARQKAFGVWIKQKLKENRPRYDSAVMGILHKEVIDAALERGVNPARLVVMTDFKVVHADREGHKADNIALSEEQYANLANLFAKPEEIYWNEGEKDALYIFSINGEPKKCIALSVRMPSAHNKAIKRLGKFDGVASVYIMERYKLKMLRLTKIK